MFAFFRTSAYSGFGGGSGSFYGVYADVFSRLAAQEARAAAAAGRAYTPPPPFGGPDTPYLPGVASFYDAWLSFATLKSFEWCAEHNPAQAPGRKIRRLMEEENRRARRAAQREHNDGVRPLAAFCRARDPRARAHAVAAEAEAARKAAEAAARRAADKAAKAAKAAAFKEAEWATAEPDPDWMLDELDALAAARGQGQSGAGRDAGDEGGEGAEAGGLYCPVCRKRFRSEAQWANHERSRKHLEALAALRAQLQDEERRAGGGSEESAGSDDDGGGGSAADDVAGGGGGARGGTRAARKKAAKAAKRFGRAQARAAAEDDDEGSSGGEGSEDEKGEKGAAGLAKELASKARVASPETELSDGSDDGGEADLARLATRKPRVEADAGSDSGTGSSSESDASDAEEAVATPSEEAPAPGVAAAVKKGRRANKGGLNLTKGAKQGAAAEAGQAAAPPRPLGKRGLKAAARRAGAGAAKAGAGAAKAAAAPPAPESATACSLCGAEHESRSALFRHLRAAHSLRS